MPLPSLSELSDKNLCKTVHTDVTFFLDRKGTVLFHCMSPLANTIILVGILHWYNNYSDILQNNSLAEVRYINKAFKYRPDTWNNIK